MVVGMSIELQLSEKGGRFQWCLNQIHSLKYTECLQSEQTSLNRGIGITSNVFFLLVISLECSLKWKLYIIINLLLPILISSLQS